MIHTPKTVDDLVALIQTRFPTFGGIKKGDGYNPLTHWEEGKPATFALGVDVKQVVEFVIAKNGVMARKRKPAKR